MVAVSASQVLGAMRQHRRSVASNCSGQVSPQRERSSAWSTGRPRRAASAARLRPDVREHRGVGEIDGQPRVRASQALVQPAGRRGDTGPVQAGLLVGGRFAVDQRVIAASVR
jgi:hypothetical protein